MGLHPVSKKTKQKRIYIEKLHWSEHDEITGKVHVAISHTVSRLNPIFQQTRNEDTSVTVTARKSVFHRFKKKKNCTVCMCVRACVSLNGSLLSIFFSCSLCVYFCWYVLKKVIVCWKRLLCRNCPLLRLCWFQWDRFILFVTAVPMVDLLQGHHSSVALETSLTQTRLFHIVHGRFCLAWWK